MNINELSLFDLHCDTAFEMLYRSQPLAVNRLAVSLEHAKHFRHYIQIMAFWINHRLTDEEGWESFLLMLDNLRRDPSVQSGKAILCDSVEIRESPTLLMGLEDARILAGKLERVDRLFEEGIRVITPLWKGATLIGGSHDTNLGLTVFGKTAMDRALSLGMILDISHASEQSADDLFELADRYSRPIIATHSDSYTVCPVSRNLRDRQVLQILRSGGIIGLNLYPIFLKNLNTATVEDVIPHIEHFLSLGAADALCLGCDMDGADLPIEIRNLADLPKLAECMLHHNYSEALIRKLFHQNAFTFFQKYLPKPKQ